MPTTKKKRKPAKRPTARQAAAAAAAAAILDNDDDNDDEFDFGGEDAAEMELADFIEAIGPSASFIKIYRAARPGEPDAFLDDVGAEGFNEQILRENYGAGKYKLKFKGPNKAGRIVYRAHKTVVIAELRPAAAVNGHGGAAADPARDENKRLFELILAMIAGQRGPDIGAMMTGMAAIMAAVNKPGSDLGSIMAAVKEMRESTTPKDPMAQLTETIDLVNKLKPGGDNKDESWGGLIREVLSGIVPTKPAGPRQLQAGQPGGAAPPQQPGAAPPGAADEGEQNVPTQEDWLRGQIDFLKQKAAAGKPPEYWARYTFENSDEFGCAAILEAMRRGAKFEHLLQFFPEIAENVQYRVWFQTFYEQLSALRNGVQPGAGPIGNVANPVSNASPGAPGQDMAPPVGPVSFAFDPPKP